MSRFDKTKMIGSLFPIKEDVYMYPGHGWIRCRPDGNLPDGDKLWSVEKYEANIGNWYSIYKSSFQDRAFKHLVDEVISAIQAKQFAQKSLPQNAPPDQIGIK